MHRSDLGGLTALLQQEEKRYKTVTQKCQDIESNTFEEYLSVVNEISALRTGTIACHIRARPLYYYCIYFIITSSYLEIFHISSSHLFNLTLFNTIQWMFTVSLYDVLHCT